MNAFCQNLRLRAATIDELLSDAFETPPGLPGDADLAVRRPASPPGAKPAQQATRRCSPGGLNGITCRLRWYQSALPRRVAAQVGAAAGVDR